MPLDGGFWAGVGAGAAPVLGLVGAAMSRRNGRLARLEREVEACKKRDAEFVIVKAGLRLLVGLVSREMPLSPELRMFRDLMDQLTSAEDLSHIAGVDELLAQLKDVP